MDDHPVTARSIRWARRLAATRRRPDGPPAPGASPPDHTAPHSDQLADAARAAAVVGWIWHRRTRRLDLAGPVAAVLGATPGGLDTFERVLAHVHPDDRAPLRRLCRCLLAHDDEARQGEFRFTAPDAPTRWIQVRGRGLRHRDGQLHTVAGVACDVTADRPGTDRAGVPASDTDAYLGCDAHGRVVTVNRRAEHLVGPASALVGQPLRACLPGLDPATVAQALHALGAGDHVEHDVPRPSGEGWLTVRVHARAGGGIGVVARDATPRDRREHERRELLTRVADDRRQLVRLASTDTLTGLANRASLAQGLAEALARGDPQRVALLFVDLDRFKLINDTLGHLVGDAVLVEVARRLRSGVLPHHRVARFGGDEFAAVVAAADPAHATGHARRLLQAIARPMHVEGHDLAVAASVGVALGESGEDPTALLARADAALHEAKRRGRDRVEVFSPRLREELREKVTIESGIRRAVRTHGLDLDWQPVWELDQGGVTGVEALVRWDHPSRGRLRAGVFVPVVEETDLIVELGTWVRRAACRQGAAWRDADQWPGTLWVNASAREVTRPGWAAQVLGELGAAGLAPGALGVEVTETAVMAEPDTALAELGALRAGGVALAIDDFGTGHSSLAYLWRFAPDVIKVDQQFVAGVDHDRGARTIIEAVVSMARSFGARTIAEGVEREAQLIALIELGCDQASGVLLAAPGPAAALDLRAPALLDDHVSAARRRVRRELLAAEGDDGSQRNRRSATTAATAPQAPSAAR